MMEISLLKSLLSSITRLSELVNYESMKDELVQKYHLRIEEILKLLKPIVHAIGDSELASDEVFEKEVTGLRQSVDELREIFKNWQLLMSKIYFVLQVESLVVKVRTHGLEVLELLKSFDKCLPSGFSAASLEHCVHKIELIVPEQTSSSIIKKAIKDHVEGSGTIPESLEKIADSLGLKSNQELLIEIVALDKLKENAEQAEKTGEAEYIDQIIALVTHMHDLLVMIKQPQTYSPVPIPPDFCCPLSLELMTDPVIVSSGQTYERAFIWKWIDLGLTVCPKTRHTLAHTNLIPNYTVKALIANWCESNNVKLPNPIISFDLNQSVRLADAYYHGARGLNSFGPPDGSLGSPTKNSFSSTATQRERASPSHHHRLSQNSLAEAAINGNGSDLERLSPRTSEDKSDHTGEGGLNSDRLLMTSPSKNDSAGTDEHLLQAHNRTKSVSSTHSNSITSQGEGAGNGVGSHAHVSDASGELAAEPQPASDCGPNVPLIEPELPLRLETGTRSHSIRRRPSKRSVSRVVSSPVVDMRSDLVEVETEVKKLVEDLKSSSLVSHIKATEKIRLLAKHNMENRLVIANCGAISWLIHLLRSSNSTVQENAVTALLNLSINDNNKIAIANAECIESLIHVLENGNPEAKENSAATLYSLSVIEENKIKIGKAGAIVPLVDLLGTGTPRGKKDAATALFNLSINHENKPRIVQAGAVKYLVELMDPTFGMVDKAVAVLSNLATIHEGRMSIGQEGGIPVLVEVVELGSARGKENAAAALLQLCTYSNRFCSIVLQEGAVPPLAALSHSGTPRAREKAQQLLQHLRNKRRGNSRT